MMARLITIPFSHYCEKARWAADYTGFAYREEKHVPGAHLVPVRMQRGKTVPILVTRHGAIKDSSAIVRFLDDVARGTPGRPRLFPDEPDLQRAVLELEALFDRTLGPATRLFAYHHGLSNPASLRRVVAPSLTLVQRVAFRAILPLLGPQIRRAYRIDASSVVAAEGRIHDVFARVGERLAGGARYLVGDAFSAADLTFAALAAPALMPPFHPSLAAEASSGDAAIDALRDALQRTPAGEHARRMYAMHRGAPRTR